MSVFFATNSSFLTTDNVHRTIYLSIIIFLPSTTALCGFFFIFSDIFIQNNTMILLAYGQRFPLLQFKRSSFLAFELSIGNCLRCSEYTLHNYSIHLYNFSYILVDYINFDVHRNRELG